MSRAYLSSANILFCAFVAGISVASIYYNQPLLEAIRDSFDASPVMAGWIPTFTQLGYAIGMLFFIPMGDLFERVRLVQIFNFLAALSLLAIALAPNIGLLLLASFAIGITSMAPQILIPYAAHHCEPAKRGAAIGQVLSGLLLGILLARTVSGFLGAWLGWRGMFGFAGVALLPISWIVGKVLPRSKPQFEGGYLELLWSLKDLVIKYPLLRESAMIGGCLFGAFSAFWSTLIFMLREPPFEWGMRAAGLFGLLGAVGALGAPLAGKFSDRANPRVVVASGLGLSLVAYAMMAFVPGSLTILVVAVILLDVGVQAAHVANQNRIFALDEAARARINTVYMFTYFIGGALGSTLAAFAWSAYRWPGVCGLAAGFLLLGILRVSLGAPRKPAPSH